jgi:rubrerythrin
MGEILSPKFESSYGLSIVEFKIADFDLLDEDMNAIEEFAAEKQRQERIKEYLAEVERLSDKEWERDKYLRNLELEDKRAYYEVLKVIGNKHEGIPTVENKCPNCGAEFQPADKFCPRCGKRVSKEPIICPGCGKSNAYNAIFCSGCGKKLVND